MWLLSSAAHFLRHRDGDIHVPPHAQRVEVRVTPQGAGGRPGEFDLHLRRRVRRKHEPAQTGGWWIVVRLVESGGDEEMQDVLVVAAANEQLMLTGAGP